MARVTQERRVDEVTEERQGIRGNPTDVRTNTGSPDLDLLSGILRELKILNVHLASMTGEAVDESDTRTE